MNAVTETKSAHKSVYAALVTAQAHMTAALKSTKNDHFKSKYADLASVKEACFAALNAEGIAVIQPIIETEQGRFVSTVFYHAATDTQIECSVPLIVAKNDMQGFGSAVTYARRYGLMSLAGIAPEDDDGNAAVAAAPKPDDVKGPSKNDDARKSYTMAQSQMRENKTLADLESWWKDPDLKAILKKLPEDWYETLKKDVLAMVEDFKKADQDTPFQEAAQ